MVIHYISVGQSRVNTDKNNASAIVSTLSSLGADERVYPTIADANCSSGDVTLKTITVDKDGKASCEKETDTVSTVVNSLITKWEPCKQNPSNSYTVTIYATDTDGDKKGDNVKVTETLSSGGGTSTPAAGSGTGTNS